MEYNLIDRTVERELIPVAKALNLGVLASAPLAKGVPSGKYHGNGNADGGRMSTQDMREFLPEPERTQRIVTAVKSVAEQTGRSMPQVALVWLRQPSVPVIPILGARQLAPLQDNLASLELTLSAEQVDSLDEAGSIEPGFPYHRYDKERTRGLAYGGMRDRLLVWRNMAHAIKIMEHVMLDNRLYQPTPSISVAYHVCGIGLHPIRCYP